MGRYDITGIGINIREVPDDTGSVKLKVQGLILDGPAHTAGVRQGDEVLAVNGEHVVGKSAFEVSSLLQGPNETFVTIKAWQLWTYPISRNPKTTCCSITCFLSVGTS